MRTIKELDLFISCPSDMDDAGVPLEIKSVLQDFNKNASISGIQIRPRYWKDNVIPSFEGPPQDLVNLQLLNESDMLVAVFGKRFGTPTANFKSGTEEEFETALSLGKQVFLYFIKPTDIKTKDIQELAKIEDFKRNHSGKGMYKEFYLIEKFRAQFEEDLKGYINEKYRPYGAETKLPFNIEECEIGIEYLDSETIKVKKTITVSSNYDNNWVFPDRLSWTNNVTVFQSEGADWVQTIIDPGGYTTYLYCFQQALSEGELKTITLMYLLKYSLSDPTYVAYTVNMPTEKLTLSVRSNNRLLNNVNWASYEYRAAPVPSRKGICQVNKDSWTWSITRPKPGSYHRLRWEFE